ncbi:hypothetical protein FRC15_002228 [Serendipita sp. 397]|nr:hypothetical protein FRC15_002228 [Serendipita sp. 397]
MFLVVAISNSGLNTRTRPPDLLTILVHDTYKMSESLYEEQGMRVMAPMGLATGAIRGCCTLQGHGDEYSLLTSATTPVATRPALSEIFENVLSIFEKKDMIVVDGQESKGTPYAL